MADKTTNFGLTKPKVTDFYDVNVHNTNMDKIDAELSKLNVFKVIFSYDGSKRKYASDKSYNEIISALDSGKTVVGYYDANADGRYTFSNCMFFPAMEGSYLDHVMLSVTHMLHNKISIDTVSIYQNDEVTMNYGSTPTCVYSTDDLTAGESSLSTGTLYLVYE